MTEIGSTENEMRVIEEARRQGLDEIQVLIANTKMTVPMCGTCGRIVCHPDCPRFGCLTSNKKNI